jgi:haloalkane dehalogenase
MQYAELLEHDFCGTFPFRPRLAKVGGYDLHYVDEGSGEPIVLLHGNPTWGYLYRKFIRPLAAHARIVVPDHLGFGKSQKPLGEGYRLADRVAHLEALLVDRLNLRDLTLVVHDWGGPIGLGFAVRHRDRVRRLVVLNTWCRRLPAETRLYPALEQFRLAGVGEVLVQGLNAFVEGVLPCGIHRKELLSEELLDAYRAPFPDFNSRRHVLAFARDIPLGEEHPSYATIGSIEDRLGDLDVKPLVLWGTQDPVFPPALQDFWREKFPHGEVEGLEHAGHFVQEDAAAEVLSRLEKFLGR